MSDSEQRFKKLAIVSVVISLVIALVIVSRYTLKHNLWVYFFIIVSLRLLDYSTTYIGKEKLGMEESNKEQRKIIESQGYVKPFLFEVSAFFIVFLLLYYAKDIPIYYANINLFSFIITFLIILNISPLIINPYGIIHKLWVMRKINKGLLKLVEK